MTLQHTFEGGTDGVTIAAGPGSNSDTPGNNYFDLVFFDNTGTPGVVAYSDVQMKRGALSARFRSGTATAFTCVAWIAGSRTDVTDDYCRAYCFLTNDFTVNQPIFYWESAAFAGQGCVYLRANREVAVGDASNAIINTSTATYSLNQWFRIEAKHHADTSASQITVRMFLGGDLDETTPDETITSSTFAGPATQSSKFYCGMPFAAGSQPDGGGFLYMDDMADNGSEWLGPTPWMPRARRSLLGMKRPVVYTMQGERRNHLWLPKRKLWRPKVWTPGGDLCPA